MATKKYLSLERLQEYDSLIKAEIDEKINANKVAIATDEDVLNALIEIDALSVITDNDGFMFADENNNILMW